VTLVLLVRIIDIMRTYYTTLPLIVLHLSDAITLALVGRCCRTPVLLGGWLLCPNGRVVVATSARAVVTVTLSWLVPTAWLAPFALVVGYCAAYRAACLSALEQQALFQMASLLTYPSPLLLRVALRDCCAEQYSALVWERLTTLVAATGCLIMFTGRLGDADVRISVDGRGRAPDNIFVEPLWRTAKYEEVYLEGYERVPVATRSVGDYFRFYNEERLH